MEIKSNNLNPYQAQLNRGETLRTRESVGVKTAQPPPAALSQPGDRVSVSRDAALCTEAFRVALAAPDVRQEKVNSLKERLASGDYRPDSRKIASRLVKAEPGLFRL